MNFPFFFSVSSRFTQCCNHWNCVAIRDGMIERIDGLLLSDMNLYIIE